MTGKELIDAIKENHLEDKTIRVFSSEKWKWIDIHEVLKSGNLDAKYLTDEHVEKLKEDTENGF